MKIHAMIFHCIAIQGAVLLLKRVDWWRNTNRRVKAQNLRSAIWTFSKIY